MQGDKQSGDVSCWGGEIEGAGGMEEVSWISGQNNKINLSQGALDEDQG